VLGKWQGEVARLNMLKTHYRQPIDWTVGSLGESQREIDRWYPLAAQFMASSSVPAPDFMAALEDDMNTPEAITVLRRLYKEAADGSASAGEQLAASGRFLGLFTQSIAEWTDWRPKSFAVDEAQVAALIKARLDARAAKNWAESDRIRGQLDAMGITLKDNKDGTTSWEVKR
jgi:cysteinyl-tRNA synthetase